MYAPCISAPREIRKKPLPPLRRRWRSSWAVPWERLPFTKPAERERDYVFADTDLVVVGTPTYAGKLPNKILPDLKARLHGTARWRRPL